jgi:hypothetical protein
MKRSNRVRWMTVLALTVAVMVPALALGGSGSDHDAGGAPKPGHVTTSSSRVLPAEVSTLASELKALQSSGATGTALKELSGTPGMPVCAPPPLPAPTQPPGAGYGIPFLAAITNGQVLTGYDEWTANHNVFKDGSTTYHLYPWQTKISNITGWVTGLLQLPSLNAEVAPQGVVFCDQGGKRCVSEKAPPTGLCIHVFAQFAPSPASKTPPPPITNYGPPGDKCWGTAGCLPIVVTLTPSGETSLTVTGVEPDGALDLQVTTAAVTTATEIPPPPSKLTFTCSNDPTTISLSTEAPTSLPPTAPGPPTPPNTDDRSLQTPPQPLTGPLATASSTLAGNDFSLPAFLPSKSSAGNCFNAGAVPILLNTYAGGWGPTFPDQNEGLYYLDGGKSPIVAEPGWAQFTATTTVVTLSIPKGPPANFHL